MINVPTSLTGNSLALRRRGIDVNLLRAGHGMFASRLFKPEETMGIAVEDCLLVGVIQKWQGVQRAACGGYVGIVTTEHDAFTEAGIEQRLHHCCEGFRANDARIVDD